MSQTDEAAAAAEITGAPLVTSPTTTAKSTFKPLGVVFTLAGVALFVYFVRKTGVGEITNGIKRLGAGFLLVLLVSSLRYMIRSMAWSMCFKRSERPPLRDIFAAYVMGDALGNLVPFGIAVSEPTKAAMVRHRVPFITALSAIAVQNLFYSLSVSLFMLSGAVTLLLAYPLPRSLRYACIGAVAVISCVIAGMFLVVYLRVKFLSGLMEKLRGGDNALARWLQKRQAKEGASELEENVYNFYRQYPVRCLFILLLEISFHFAGVLEVFVTMSFISDVAPSLLTAYLLESVNRFVNVVFKAVPFRAGVDEVITGFFTKTLRFGTTAGGVLAIVRKGRVLCWTALGLALFLTRGLSLRAVTTEAHHEAQALQRGGK